MRKYLALTTLALTGLCYCVGDYGEPDAGSDAGTDGATDGATDGSVEAAPGSFTLTLAPGHVTADPGDKFQVTINVIRNAFGGTVDFTVSPQLGLTVSQPAPALGNLSTFDLSASGTIAAGNYDIVITGTSGSINQQVHLGVLVGSAVVLDGGPFTVPSYTTSITAKLWGAGGGTGGYCGAGAGAAGGGGGFASATFPVDPGSTFLVDIGKAGGTGSCSGGGGGGYSALRTPDGGPMILAGGGGGGGSGTCLSSYYIGFPGGAGGGLAGDGTSTGNCGATGGKQDAGGAPFGLCGGASGTAFKGGAGNSGGGLGGGAAGGVPGGGAAGVGAACTGYGGGGGGGGGYYGGGGSGSYYNSFAAGGAGGSGYNPFDGGTLTSGAGNVPGGANDPDFGDAGAGYADKAGRIVVRLGKP